MRKKKLAIIIIVCLAVMICLIPSISRYEDGGTVQYKAVLYQILDYNALDDRYESGYYEGVVVKVLGFEVYNNTPDGR